MMLTIPRSRRQALFVFVTTLLVCLLLGGVPAAWATPPRVAPAPNVWDQQGISPTDTTPPAAPQNLTVVPADWTNTNIFTFTWTNPVDESGIGGVYYKLGSEPVTTTDGVFVAGQNIETLALSFPGLPEGLSTIYFWLQDGAGNADATTRAPVGIRYDVSSPLAPNSPNGSPLFWTNQNDFTITLTGGIDLQSGLGGTWYKITPNVDQLHGPTSPTDGFFVPRTANLPGQLHVIEHVTVPYEGTWAVWTWLQDRAGNANHNNNNKSANLFHYDASPPTVIVSTPEPDGNDGWYRTPITVSAEAIDQSTLSNRVADIAFRLDDGEWMTQTINAVSGVGTKIIDSDGLHQLRVRASDTIHNVSMPLTHSFQLDTTPPEAVLNLTGQLGNNGWYTSGVVGSVAVNDALSGPASAFWQVDGGAWTSGTTFTVTAEGQHSVGVYGADVAGNTGAPQVQSFRIDTQPPTVTISFEGALGANGWFTSDQVTVTLTPADSGSGVAQTFWRIDNFGSFRTGASFQVQGDGQHVIYFYGADLAGNQHSSPLTATIKIDHRAPALSLDAPQPAPADVWRNNNAFTVTWTTNPTDTSGIGGAFYKLGGPPPCGAGDVCGQSSEPYAIRNIAVPGSGVHDVYVWLYDQAGNSNPAEAHHVADAFWFDSEAPTAAHSPIDSSLIFSTPQTITLSATDQLNLSGIKEIWYQIVNGTTGPGAWQSRAGAAINVAITQDGRNTINYYAVDNAGNQSQRQNVTVNVDQNAPAPPVNLQVTGAGVWQREPGYCYRVSWTEPVEPFGLVGSYYVIGAAPTTNDERWFHPGRTTGFDCLTNVPQGRHDLHVWLRDRAGNADPAKKATLTDAIWWDPTPPTTTLSYPPPTGQNGWHTVPVTVTFNVTDGVGSGVAADGIHFRVQGGQWQRGPFLPLNTEGHYTIDYSSTDIAGNVELTQTQQLRIDTKAPEAHILPLATLQAEKSFTVSWMGSDTGSGLRCYDVEYKDALNVSWTPWQSCTQGTEALFDQGERGHVYFFRIRARDQAGVVGAFSGGTPTGAYTFIQPIENGAFANNALQPGWAPGSNNRLPVQVVTSTDRDGRQNRMALLGDPTYPDRPPNGQVPQGTGRIVQTIRIPAVNELPDVTSLTLSFWYNLWTCDSMVHSREPTRVIDSFDVTLTTQVSSTLLIRDGNPDYTKICDPQAANAIPSAQSLGWKRVSINLLPLRGQEITLSFENWNRFDNSLNTWTYVDDVSVSVTVSNSRDCQISDCKLYIPIVRRAASAQNQLRLQLPALPATFPPPVRGGQTLPTAVGTPIR